MAQARVHENGWVYVEFQPRATFAPVVRGDHVILRAAAGVQLPAGFQLWAGLAYIDGEQRVFEQAFWGNDFGPLRLSVRARLEQRFLPDDPVTKHRVRVQLRAAWTFKDSFLLIVYDEPFVNLPFTFDQNRAYVALGYRPHPKVLLELGYLNQLTTRHMGHTPLFTIGLGF
ncbi:MAG: DUF2490 domain-containing protein [Myxococcaceae bacterium]|nr:DUF2490 domain-containing protein [Myxococcaceae bacterium]